MPRSARTLGTVLGCWLVLGGALVRLAWPPGLDAAHPETTLLHASPVRTLPLLLASAVLGTGVWLALTVLLTALSRAPGRPGQAAGSLLRMVSPVLLRRAAEAVLGATTVLTVVPAAAQAAPPPTAHHVVAGTRPTESVDLDRPVAPAPREHPLPSLDRPARDPSRGIALVSPPGARTPAHQAKAVQVRVGDSLWRIAARALPPGATDDQIEHAWHRWYATNRAVIGDDPDLLVPGQLLTPPTT